MVTPGCGAAHRRAFGTHGCRGSRRDLAARRDGAPGPPLVEKFLGTPTWGLYLSGPTLGSIISGDPRMSRGDPQMVFHQVRASGPYLQFGTADPVRVSTVDAQSPTHALKLLEPKLIFFLNLTVLLRSPTALLKPALLKPTVVATADLCSCGKCLPGTSTLTARSTYCCPGCCLMR